jgi:rhodanese-related sulfurtransferase
MMIIRSEQENAYTDVTPEQAAELAEVVKAVDVRRHDNYFGELGHITGSNLVPAPVLEVMSQTWETEIPILVVCRFSRRSAAAKHLVSRGFTQILNLVGSMLAWNEVGLDAYNEDALTACDSGFAIAQEAV